MNIEETKQYHKEYYQKNKERLSEYHKRYYQENKEEINQHYRDYRNNNKEKLKAYRQEHKEEKKAYNQAYQQEHKEEIKAYCDNPEVRRKHREVDKIYKRKARLSGKVNGTEEFRKWKEKHPLGVLAQQKINYRIKTGQIKREKCQVCGRDKAHAHHPDYTKPLEVLWLCSIHHQRLHLGLIKLDLVAFSY